MEKDIDTNKTSESETTPYDSTVDTKAHAELVTKYAKVFGNVLMARGLVHDNSKLEEPEKSVFDVATPKLRKLTYGSPEHTEQLKSMKVALDHHYANNRHHPEHHENGIDDMNLFDLDEMFIDWMASTKRHDDGNLEKSIDFNAGRFKMSDQLAKIFHNTRKQFGE